MHDEFLAPGRVLKGLLDDGFYIIIPVFYLTHQNLSGDLYRKMSDFFFVPRKHFVTELIELFDYVKVRFIEDEEVDRFDPQHISFFNINTKEDLERAKKIAGGADY